MKRTLWSIAALSALPLATHAQSSVTFYGLLDAGLAHERTAAGSVTKLANLAFPSRIGLRGVEDLGGGLAAGFQLEGDIGVDAGTAGAAGVGLDFMRVSLVTLKGGWGELQAGRGYTPGFLSALNHDNLAYGFYNSLLVFSAGAAGITTRYSNALFYNTPEWAGFSLRSAIALGERTAQPRQLGDSYGLGAKYAAGPVTLDAYYQVDHIGTPAATPTSAPGRAQSGLGGQWKTRWATFNAGYGRAETRGLDNRSADVNVGVTIPFTASELLFEVQRVQTHVATGLTPRATAWGATYRYFLSKRTTVYATAGQTRNNASGTFPLFSTKPTAAGRPGDAPRGFGIGVMHTF